MLSRAVDRLDLEEPESSDPELLAVRGGVAPSSQERAPSLPASLSSSLLWPGPRFALLGRLDGGLLGTIRGICVACAMEEERASFWAAAATATAAAAAAAASASPPATATAATTPPAPSAQGTAANASRSHGDNCIGWEPAATSASTAAATATATAAASAPQSPPPPPTKPPPNPPPAAAAGEAVAAAEPAPLALEFLCVLLCSHFHLVRSCLRLFSLSFIVGLAVSSFLLPPSSTIVPFLLQFFLLPSSLN
mmetsp:Transcript_5212/g.11312  ORF Transcript_5212/g.11312 Transcript_5212/m.11312 type:complete len:252 (-) Transcript_5212:99-854(-)